ncbi:uncharacterized protein LOC121854594 isoform X3 [Homarus americanus]|uniref:uncharacterized protein LOC121854594 isoform X3 n=1 Tax=Homarus americanus TaxID=6706 RepID=UPI001C468821|nr:uncharacterized protein LOC121854594 isoform X3 [Homarus americanus]
MRTLLAVTIIFATVLGTGWSLKCYQCNSHDKPDCKGLTTDKASEYLVECGDKPDGEKYTLCRKLDIYLDMDFGKHHPAENRVHRDCGYEVSEESSENDCYYKSGYNTRSWVCACNEDGCNAATVPSAAAAAILLPLAAALAAVLRGVY